MNVVPTSTVGASSSMGPYPVRWVKNGDRGTQVNQQYWNNANQWAVGETVTVTFPGQRAVNRIELQMPIMNISGPYTLGGITVQLLNGQSIAWSVGGVSLTGGTTLATCVDYNVTLGVPVNCTSLRIVFGPGNQDGWVFIGEVRALCVVRTVAEALEWLRTTGEQMTVASRQQMTNGVGAYPPQVGAGYGAFWLRDYAYILQGGVKALNYAQMADAAITLCNAQRYDGAQVDCVKYDGTPVYQPGFGTMGANPVLDGGAMAVDVMYQTWLCGALPTGEVAGKLPSLLNGLNAVPLVGWLAHITSVGWDRCPYGFTDTVRKQGGQLFDSLLLVQAWRQMSEMYTAAGDQQTAASCVGMAGNISAAISGLFDYNVGLYRACNGQCGSNYDIWGSAFSVRLGVANATQRTAICNYLVNNYSSYVYNGHIRHLPGGTYWEVAGAADTYQNGAYWGTPVGWVAYAIDYVNPALADSLIVSYTQWCQVNGVYEWIIGSTYGVPQYTSSVTLPVEGIRAMLRRRNGEDPGWAPKCVQVKKYYSLETMNCNCVDSATISLRQLSSNQRNISK